MGVDRADRGGSDAGVLSSAPRRAIVDALRSHRPGPDALDPSGLTAGQLAELLGLHPTTVRFHTERLEAAGLVRSHLSTAFGVGRPRKVYVATPVVDDAERSGHLLHLLEAMTESFTAGTSPEAAGERWAQHHLSLPTTPAATSAGAWLSKIGPVVDVLQDWGYHPEVTTSAGGRECRISLTGCPFRELAEAHPDVVCGVHLGLLRGALRQLGEEDIDVRLLPFTGPDRCDAHVATRRPFATHDSPPDSPPDSHREELLDESGQSDAAGPDLGSPVLHPDGGQ